MLIYAGIGARKTPGPICQQMHSIALQFRAYGWLLRSGGAKLGADVAFEIGAAKQCEIFRAEDATPEAFDHAAKFHPAWEKCSATAQALHARNSLVMLGRYLNAPVKFAVCWTENGAIKGGTGQSIRIAKAYEIPVFNLAIDGDYDRLRRFAGALL